MKLSMVSSVLVAAVCGLALSSCGNGEVSDTAEVSSAAAEVVAEVATVPEIRYYRLASTCPFCDQIVSDVHGLETEYEGKLRFTVVANDLPGSAEALELHKLGTHGLVALSPQGEELATIPGHAFGRDEILGVIGKILP